MSRSVCLPSGRYSDFKNSVAAKILRSANGAERLGLRQSSAALGIALPVEKRQRAAAVQNLAVLLVRPSKFGYSFN
jgi:hypothetical protein